MSYFIASFPKSGNTWVRFIVANILNAIEKKYDEIDFYNIHAIIPEVSTDNDLENISKNGIYKTHMLYSVLLDNVVYVVRNPFDALYSYYHYINYEKNQIISLVDLVHDSVYGIKPLLDHVESYVNGNSNLLLLRYEDLKNGDTKDIYTIAQFLGLKIDDEIARKVISLSSFENMRDVEMRKGRKFGSPNFTFTRSGKVGEGTAKIKDDPNLVAYITRYIGNSPLLSKYYLS